jgi:hypothetical protein
MKGNNTREDCENGFGFPVKSSMPGGTQAEAVLAIAEQDANARLIAAAPDLLEALKALLVMCHSPEPVKLDEALTWRENDERAEAMARAAIAKATADY